MQRDCALGAVDDKAYKSRMTEILFYHLTQSRVEQALPGLLERSLERGWNVVVQTGDLTKVNALDEHLWVFRDDSFLPHAARGEGADDDTLSAVQQPIWITAEEENPNDAAVRFLVHGATIEEKSGYDRIVLLFDGHDPDAVADARNRWKMEKEQGNELTYWQQNDGGGWQKNG